MGPVPSRWGLPRAVSVLCLKVKRLLYVLPSWFFFFPSSSVHALTWRKTRYPIVTQCLAHSRYTSDFICTVKAAELRSKYSL